MDIALSIYNERGEITSTIRGDESAIGINRELYPCVDGEYDAACYYVDTGRVVSRPPCPAQLTGHTLVALPVPCWIEIGEHTYPCIEPTAELEFDQPGTYTVRVTSWPYQDKEFTVEN